MRPDRCGAGINWTFFRENFQGAALCHRLLQREHHDDLAMDFTVAARREACEQILPATDYATKDHRVGIHHTKANIIRPLTTVLKDYPRSAGYPGSSPLTVYGIMTRHPAS